MIDTQTIANTGTMTNTEVKFKNHTSLRQTISNSLTMAYRGLLQIRRTPQQLADVVIQPILFTLMFVYVFGGAIAGNVQNYLPMVIPGILVMSVITASMATGVQLREDMDKGVFNRFKSLPIARIAPLAGALMADTVRYGVATLLTFIMGFILGFRLGAGPAGAIAGGLLAILFAWCLSWVWAYLGVIVRTASTVQGISMAILMPLSFLSNAFVPTASLPGWLKTFANLNPISYLVSAVRQLCQQGTIGYDFWMTIVGALVLVAIFAPLTVRAYMRKA
jgi:ABC-2 type transport system permease protein